MMLHTKYQGSIDLGVSDNKIFKVFISKIYFTLCDIDIVAKLGAQCFKLDIFLRIFWSGIVGKLAVTL